MSVGSETDIGSLGPVPENFIIAPFVPQTGLLQNVDVFVSHGGLNSTMESLYFGVPLVVVPSIAEQRLTARRIQELGLGVTLDHERLTAEVLRESALTAARDPQIRAQVNTMQRYTRTAGGCGRAAQAITQFAMAGSA
jgi:MGT family glycosyltransferase